MVACTAKQQKYIEGKKQQKDLRDLRFLLGENTVSLIRFERETHEQTMTDEDLLL